jgi:hypothetical protein
MDILQVLLIQLNNTLNMKKVILPIVAISTLLFGSCGVKDDVYVKMSEGMCDCMTRETKELSPEIKEVIIEAEKNGDDLKTAVNEFAATNPELAIKDGQIMQDKTDDMLKCRTNIEEVFSNIFDVEGSETTYKKLLKKMSADKNCAFPHAFLKSSLVANGLKLD